MIKKLVSEKIVVTRFYCSTSSFLLSVQFTRKQLDSSFAQCLWKNSEEQNLSEKWNVIIKRRSYKVVSFVNLTISTNIFFNFFIHFASLLCTELDKVFPVKIMILKITLSTKDYLIRQKLKWISKKVFVNRIWFEKLLNQLKLLRLFSNYLAFLKDL